MAEETTQNTFPKHEVAIETALARSPSDLAPKVDGRRKKLAMRADSGDQTFLMATNPHEMGKAQQSMVKWVKHKIQLLQEEAADHKANLDIAKKRKIRTEAYQRYLLKTEKRIEMFEKVEAALKAGFCIIPDMDMDIFAIRTDRKKPKQNMTSGSTKYGGGAHVRDQETNSPPVGEGRYVDIQPFTKSNDFMKKNDRGEEIEMETRWAVRFDETIDFPFKLAKPAILDKTTQALGLKVFDELGVLPRRRGADPVVVGRIKLKEGLQTKTFNFLITWFLDLKDL
jgi:hypothetical protein